MVVPDLPFDAYWICTFQLWEHREVIYVVLSLVYGTLLLLSTVHPLTSNSFCVKDALALLIIIYSAKRYGDLTCGGGVPRLLGKVRQDATMYFLMLSTGHIIFLFFEIFAHVSDRPIDLYSAAHNKAHRLQLSGFPGSKSPSQIL